MATRIGGSKGARLGHSLTRLVKGLADWSLEHRPRIEAARREWDAKADVPS
ncbi:hypothetical protein [Streptomyces sp. NPDC090021]|uniref:hypothetical protein n=1 Tax=Streptomyces sp. NPDC090021 TaxID=3365919 RepID=UPI003814C722